MRFLIILLLCAPFVSLANPVHDTVEIYSERPLLTGEKTFWLPVNFDASLLLAGIPDSLNGLAILQIDLVYTTYKSSPSFNQHALNDARIRRLAEHWPQVQDDRIEWNIIGQSRATDDPSARKLFHGFVIYYRHTPTAESITEEIAFLDAFLGITGTNDEEEDLVPVEVNAVSELESSAVIMPVIHGEMIETSKETTWIGFELTGCHEVKQITRQMRHKERQALQDSVSVLPDFMQCAWFNSGHFGWGSTHFVWAEKRDSCDKDSIDLAGVSRMMVAPEVSFAPVTYAWMGEKEYGVVSEVYQRNPAWTNTLIVMDVTGSMSPYIAKTMAWVKASRASEQVHAFVFFNDGNSTPDRQKRTGEVGGIYWTENTSFTAVYERMKMTMQKGGGGDCPENNVEATLEGIALYPGVGEIVMVADNWATPRDLALVKELDRPVHVILCGASGGVNLAYIQLAYDTGGSVHTIEEDLDLRNIEPGRTFRLGRFYYTLLDGKIVKAEHK